MSGTGTGEQRIPLTEWMQQFWNIDNPTTVSSADYLILALRLTCSLTEKLCKVKEETGRSPELHFDWIDSILVKLKSNSRKKDDTENVLDNISSNDDDISVEILPSLFDRTEKDATQMDGILYSLGIVFFQIFSRGERPIELEQKQLGKMTPNEIGMEFSECFAAFRQDKTNDLADELNVYQNLLSDFNWSDDDSTSDTAARGDGPRKKRIQIENYNMCSVSVEPLIEKGVPMSVCDLIANMLDCANGVLRKGDTYNDISEVRGDLQLMLNKPAVYLYDLNMGRLSTTGLQSGDIFGRNTELSIIKDAYRRTVSGDTELVTISGRSGTGKTLLAHEFGKYVLASGGIFLSGKFDQLQLGRPFSALASAFDQYCSLLQTCELAPSKQILAQQLNHVLGRDAYHLIKLIPNLANILSLDMNSIIHDEGCSNPQKRLQYLLCLFLEAISSAFAAPVTLFLDDLQWADSASIAAVNQLLLTGGIASQKTQFFFLGSYRDGEARCNPLWKTMCNSDYVNARCTNVKLDNMDEKTLDTMIAETLCLSPRLTRPLSSVIYHKTRGNLLFVSRLMISLSKEGLLRTSLSRRRWEWDLEKITCQKLPDDVAAFFTHSIKALSEDVKSSLCVLSCFGSSADISFVKTLERVLHKQLLIHLDLAAEEGLLDKKDGVYQFSHDRIQEAAYNMMDFLDRCRFHFSCGMALAPLSAREEDDSILLTAVNQINLAGPEAVQEKSQNSIVANFNLLAGKKSMEMSDFSAAYSYFDNGISFLRKKHWEQHYALSLELFEMAAKCALTNGDLVSLKLLSEQVMQYGRSYEDKLNTMYFFTSALALSSRLPESIEKGLSILATLGIYVRGNESSMEVCVQETKDLLSSYTDDEILNTKPMTDPTMIIAMKFLGKVGVGMNQIRPESSAYVTQRIIQLSLTNGMNPVSPLGFAYLGSYMAKLGYISEGYHYVKLASSLLNRVGSRESAGEVICIGTQVRAYVEPLQATLEFHNEGFAAAMVSGDIIQATMNILIYGANCLNAGMNLQKMQKKCDEWMNFMRDRKMLIFMVQLQCSERSVLKLIGSEEKPKHVSADEEKILATNNSVKMTYYFHNAYISFMYRLHDDSKQYAERYLDCFVNIWPMILIAHSYHAFYIGLISFWLARKSRDRQHWLEEGNSRKLALKKWAESSQWTFENKWYLLEAEESYCNNDFDRAKLFYEKAVSSAKDHKFVHEEALACELAAYFYLDVGDAEKATQYFLLAHEKYHNWGAFGKCDSLFNFVQGKFSSLSVGNEHFESTQAKNTTTNGRKS